jgi:dCMP deaminase
MKNKKITKTDLKFIEKLYELEKKSKCIRAQIGAIVVKDGEVLVEGCNDIPHDEYDCNLIGCIRTEEHIPSGQKREVCLGLCAEQYAISKAAERGVSLNNASIYISTYPCRICCSLIVNSGIKRVVYKKKYPQVIEQDILNDAGIEVIHLIKN